jgi:hypothetical protein
VGHVFGKSLADEVASAESTTRIVDTGRRGEAGTVRRASGNDVAHVEEHRDLHREQPEDKQDGAYGAPCPRGAVQVFAACAGSRTCRRGGLTNATPAYPFENPARWTNQLSI